jgi:hypothetical protein
VVRKNDGKYDRTTMGYGRHGYKHLDVSAINPADYATSMRGEEEHLGDVRQYNAAYNEPNEKMDVSIDWLCRVGTIIRTQATEWKGEWVVRGIPNLKDGVVHAVLSRTLESDDILEISCAELGITAGTDNLYLDVETILVSKGVVGRDTREAMTVQGKA